ncbi:MAG TPA: ParB/RepB/Spo0J family partition protein [Planctomycetota bacterium]|nr:ParB/RepB/Spo0J family partition protein [Planctomycetota bacterium]
MERRLGRGLGSLLGQKATDWTAPAAEDPRTDVALELIQPNPFQPRTEFSEEGLQELRESLRLHGLLQPVVLRPSGGGYQLISGERRCRAARALGWPRIPAVVREGVTDELMLELALVENLQRRDLDPIERAKGFRLLAERFGLTQEGISEKVGLKRSSVANHLRLLELSEGLQRAVSEGLLTMGHARALLALPEESDRERLAELVVREELSVRDVERRIRELQDGPATTTAVPSPSSRGPGALQPPAADTEPQVELEPWAKSMTDALTKRLGTRVQVRNRPGYQGQIVIDYFGREELDRIFALIAPRETI